MPLPAGFQKPTPAPMASAPSKGKKATKAKGKLKTTGTYKGKSNKLGYGGQSAQLKDMGVPGGVIGNLARKAGTAPGMPNFHGGKKKK